MVSLPLVTAAQQKLIYDANGNLITGDGKFREYNGFNQLVRIRQGNSSSGMLLEEYIYHPTEERVLIKRTYNGTGYPINVVLYVNDNFVREYGHIQGSTMYVNDSVYAKDDSGIVGEMRYNGSRNGSRYNKLKTLYYHNDLKGSVAVITNSTGAVIQQTFYDPFGNILQGGNKTRYSYENKEYDNRINTYDFQFRQYNPMIGKFTQPDSLMLDIYDPQQLNRYSFERNNPFAYLDHTGHSMTPWGLQEIKSKILSHPVEFFNNFAGNMEEAWNNNVANKAVKFVYERAPVIADVWTLTDWYVSESIGSDPYWNTPEKLANKRTKAFFAIASFETTLSSPAKGSFTSLTKESSGIFSFITGQNLYEALYNDIASLKQYLVNNGVTGFIPGFGYVTADGRIYPTDNPDWRPVSERGGGGDHGNSDTKNDQGKGTCHAYGNAKCPD